MKIYLTWDECFGFYQALAGRIKGKTKQPFDLIIAISKGGLIPSRMIAKHLNIERVISYGVRSYNEGDTQLATRIVYQDLPSNIDSLIKGKRCLIVDDIIDTGDTIIDLMDKLVKYHPKEVQCAATHYKSHSKIKPEFSLFEIKDEWLVFPFE